MAQYGDKYGHVQNQEFDSQAVHEKSDVNMADRGIATHEGKNSLNSGDNPLAQEPQQQNLKQSGDEFGEGAKGNKKGLTEKIEEKTPVIGRNQEQSSDKNNIVDSTAPTDSTTRPGGEGNFAEKKREIMEKIKEKVPGGCDQKEHQSHDNNKAVDTPNIQGGERGVDQKNEDIMEKIKAKIPGVGPNDKQSHDTNGTVDKSTIPSGGEVAEQKDEVMDEIKEKVPRVGSNKEQSRDTSATTIPSEKGEHGDENKGSMIEKIKEKLAGHN